MRHVARRVIREYIETEFQDKVDPHMKTQQPTAPLSTFTPHDGELEVVEVHDTDTNVKRMCELGVCPGNRIKIIRRGDPSILSVGDSRFALSGKLLVNVFVRPSA